MSCMQADGVYFFHIPKTAGMSLNGFLDASFPTRETCPFWLWDQLIAVPRSELTQWRVFRGHFLSHLEPYLGRELTKFTLLRNPVERTISHYEHVRRAPDHPFHQHARRLSLAEFCVHPQTRHMVYNYQSAFLAKRPCDVAEVANGLPPDYASRFELQERLTYPDGFPNPMELLERAEERLSTFKVVGITEKFEETVGQISRVLKCPKPEIVERRNANPEPRSSANLDSATLELILQLTEVDQCLYRSALSRFAKPESDDQPKTEAVISRVPGNLIKTRTTPVSAMTPREFVEALYCNCLGRSADHEGLAGWTELIRSTGDPTLVLKSILASAEYSSRAKSALPNGAHVHPRLGWHMSDSERIEMTVACHDSDLIPKVEGAGEIFLDPSGTLCQRMHNGLRVVAGGYHGEWMSEIIRRLKGHHEPQEEILFHTILPLIAAAGSKPVMLELGSFWGYYSLWFRSLHPGGRNLLVEPDANNVQVGKRNFRLNEFDGEFIEAAVGIHDGFIDFPCESDGQARRVRTISVDGLLRELGLERIHLLHADIQGAELSLLEGMKESVERGRLNWLFLSTHHHSLSGDPLTHQRCLEWLQSHGAFILSEHSVAESFSGDGLIVAAFSGHPQMMPPAISRNTPSRSLFRETEYDPAEALEEIRRRSGTELRA
jgi:FkbM family methyltransferase